MNIILFRFDAVIDGLYARSRSLYFSAIGGAMVAAMVLTGLAAALAMPGSLGEALFGGSAGVLAFMGARAIVTHYQRANPEDFRPTFRERLGLNRGKTLGGVAIAWVFTLFVLGAQGVQHPAIGAFTIMVALTLVVLATRTPEEKTALQAEQDDYAVWSSDAGSYDSDDEYGEYDDDPEDNSGR